MNLWRIFEGGRSNDECVKNDILGKDSSHIKMSILSLFQETLSDPSKDADDRCEPIYQVVISRKWSECYAAILDRYRQEDNRTRRTAVSYFLDAWQDVWLGHPTLHKRAISVALEQLVEVIEDQHLDVAYHALLKNEFGVNA